jgi:hypothetical protein
MCLTLFAKEASGRAPKMYLDLKMNNKRKQEWWGFKNKALHETNSWKEKILNILSSSKNVGGGTAPPPTKSEQLFSQINY